MCKLKYEDLVNRLAEEARKFRKSNLRKRNIVLNGVQLCFQMDLDEKYIVISSEKSVSFLVAETSRKEYRAFFDNLLKGFFGDCGIVFDCIF